MANLTTKLSTLTQIFRLWGHLSSRRKKQLWVLVALTVISSLSEIISIGATLPFLGVLTAPESIFDHKFAQPALEILEIQSPQGLILPCTLLFTFAVIFAGAVRIILLWFQTRLSVAIGADFSVKVYELALYQPYSVHLSRNSSEILAGSQKASNLVQNIIQPTLNCFSSAFILVSMILTLLSIQPLIALTAFLGFGLIYLLVVNITKRLIANNSLTIAAQQGRVTKAIQEGLGGIRDVIIDGTQSVFTQKYREAFIPMRVATASNQVIAGSPRFGLEALGMVLIAFLAYSVASDVQLEGGFAGAIPMLGALVLGVQRMLPILQQIYSSYINVKGGQASIQDALDLLDEPLPNHAINRTSKALLFQNAICLQNLGFRYNFQGPWVLRNINLEIPKGSRVGFIGVTGSGKSTLLDVVMGLLVPSEGSLLVDGSALSEHNTSIWRTYISHVPQSIFLADTTIAENIAFGVRSEQIDLQRVMVAAEQARLVDMIKSLEEGYNTIVGERGIRLSGGQRQRIGIARALYKGANVLILDEATSSLDDRTEVDVMDSVYALGRKITVLIIAHRLTTLKNCDIIIELADGKIRSKGGYEKITKIDAS